MCDKAGGLFESPGNYELPIQPRTKDIGACDLGGCSFNYHEQRSAGTSLEMEDSSVNGTR